MGGKAALNCVAYCPPFPPRPPPQPQHKTQLASLELDDSELHGGLDTSIASSQLTDFLVQHGVLSPSRASSREQLAELSSSSSSSSSSASSSSPASSPYRRAPAAAAASTTTRESMKNTNTSTPERRNLATRLHAAGLSEYDPHTAPSFHQENNDTMDQTPCSDVSSLGLASPPRHPYQPIMQGTGGEALPPPRRPLDTPAAVRWQTVICMTCDSQPTLDSGHQSGMRVCAQLHNLATSRYIL